VVIQAGARTKGFLEKEGTWEGAGNERRLLSVHVYRGQDVGQFVVLFPRRSVVAGRFQSELRPMRSPSTFVRRT